MLGRFYVSAGSVLTDLLCYCANTPDSIISELTLGGRCAQRVQPSGFSDEPGNEDALRLR
jgi:hypothetical protein